MQAFEFEALYDNGTITVPENIRNKIYQSHVKIILFQTEQKKGDKRFVFDAVSIDTKSFVFNRDEANER
jgi:hypothetical protein